MAQFVARKIGDLSIIISRTYICRFQNSRKRVRVYLARMYGMSVGNEEVSRLASFLLSSMRDSWRALNERRGPPRVMLAWYHGQPNADVQDGTPSCRHADAVDAGSRRGNRIACRQPWCPVPRPPRSTALARANNNDDNDSRRLTSRLGCRFVCCRDRYARGRAFGIEHRPPPPSPSPVLRKIDDKRDNRDWN